MWLCPNQITKFLWLILRHLTVWTRINVSRVNNFSRPLRATDDPANGANAIPEAAAKQEDDYDDSETDPLHEFRKPVEAVIIVMNYTIYSAVELVGSVPGKFIGEKSAVQVLRRNPTSERQKCKSNEEITSKNFRNLYCIDEIDQV